MAVGQLAVVRFGLLELARVGFLAVVLFPVPSAIAQTPTSEALWQAARKGDLPAVEAALAAGVEVDAKTSYGATALSFAADRGHVEIVRYLLTKNADPNVKDTFYNATPMTWATIGKRYEIMKALALAGADDLDSVLTSAIQQSDLEFIKAIAAEGSPSRSVLREGLKLAKQSPKNELGDEMVAELQGALDRLYPQVHVVSEALQSYVGTYSWEDQVRLEVSLEDGNLVLQLDSGTKQAFEADAQTEFSGAVGKVSFELIDERVEAAVLTAGGGTRKFRRLTDAEVAALPKIEAAEANSPSMEVANDEFPVSSPASIAADLAISGPNWGQFRGNGARGIADGQKPPALWDADKQVNLRWKTAIPGLGHSCPVVWEDRVYVTSAISGKEADLRIGLYGDVTSVEDNSEHEFITVCLSAQTGETLWQKTACKRVPQVKRHLKSTHANSTVATDGKFVVSWFGSEGLYCYSIDGELLWEKDLGLLDSGWFYDRDYQWQFGASPIIHSGRLILQCDIQDQSFLAMLDVATGEEIWRTERQEIPSWSTPTVVATPAGLQVVTNATGAARGYEFETGKLVWSIGPNSEIAVPTPISAHGMIYISSGYRPIQPIYAIRLDAMGDLTLADGASQSEYVAWSESKGGPYMPSPIAYGDYLYVCSNSGILTCHQAQTGKLVYKKRLPMNGSRSFVGSPVAADGKLYFTSEEGETAVVKAGPTFELIATNSCGEICLTTPAISGGIFFLRGQRHLYAFREAGE